MEGNRPGAKRISYESVQLELSPDQKKRLMKCAAVQVAASGIGKGEPFMLTKRQANKARTAQRKNQGFRLQMDASQIRKNQTVTGEGIVDDIVDGAKRAFNLARPVIKPFARPAAKRGVAAAAAAARTRLPPAVVSILQGLANQGVDAVADRVGLGSVMPTNALGPMLRKHKKGGSFIPVGNYM
jgi:hypothetical protein